MLPADVSAVLLTCHAHSGEPVVLFLELKRCLQKKGTAVTGAVFEAVGEKNESKVSG